MQLPHLERAHGHATAAAAKEAGNAHFKAGEYPDAAACYALALSLAADGGGGAAARVVLHSNHAAAFLKLRRGGEALACCEAALREAEKAAAEKAAAEKAEKAAAEKAEKEAAEKAEKEAAEKAAAEKKVEEKEAAGVGCAVLSKVQYRKALAHEMERQWPEARRAMEAAIAVDPEGARSLEITRDHSRSPEVSRDHPR